MRRITSSFVLLGCLALAVPAGAHGRRHQPAVCPSDPAAAVAAACPADGRPREGGVVPWRSHSRYVSCVAQAACMLRRDDCVTSAAKRRLVSCAEHSTVGRPRAVVCGVGDARRIAATATRCIAAGGIVLGTGSVCEDAAPTPTPTTTTTTTTSTTSTTLEPNVTVGNAVEFESASLNEPGYLLGGPIVVPSALVVTRLGVIGKAGGPSMVLALYADAQGAPGALLTSTDPAPLALGPNEIDVAPVAVAPGIYWMLGTYDATASIGIEEPVDELVHFAVHAVGTPLPDPFESSGWYPGQRFNYYLRGND